MRPVRWDETSRDNEKYKDRDGDRRTRIPRRPTATYQVDDDRADNIATTRSIRFARLIIFVRHSPVS